MDNRKKPDIFVISSQVPLKKLGESMDCRQGKSGQIVQRLTGCDMLVMSDDPISDAEAAMLKSNINHDSWVVITGHGNEDGGFDEITGITDKFLIDTQFLFDETLPVEDKKYPISRYVEILTEKGNLNKGDHINLMLFVCHAAMDNQKIAKKSFAEYLGKALAEKGVTSCIIANESTFLRLKNPFVHEIKIKNKDDNNISSRPEPPFVFMTNLTGETLKYRAPGDVTLNKDGVKQDGVTVTRIKYNESFMKDGEFHVNINNMYDRLDEAIKSRWNGQDYVNIHDMYVRLDEAIKSRWNGQDYDANKVTLKAFMTRKEDAGKSLHEDSPVKFTIGVSESKPDHYRISYFDKGRVFHALFNDCEVMLKFIDNKSLWYSPLANYECAGLDNSPTDQPTPPRTRIGFFDDGTDNARNDSQPGLDKGQDTEKRLGKNKKK